MKDFRQKTYHLDFKPLAWSRAGYNRVSGFYDTQARDKTCMRIYLENQHFGEELFHKPCRLDVVFYMPIPANHYRKKVQPIHHVFTPDLDNLIKYLLDSIKGIIIADDRMVCSITAKKIYTSADSTRTEFTITEVE